MVWCPVNMGHLTSALTDTKPNRMPHSSHHQSVREEQWISSRTAQTADLLPGRARAATHIWRGGKSMEALVDNESWQSSLSCISILGSYLLSLV